LDDLNAVPTAEGMTNPIKHQINLKKNHHTKPYKASDKFEEKAQ